MTDQDEDAPPVAIVIDNGSATIKAGLSEEESPNSVFPSLIGRYKCPPFFLPSNPKAYGPFMGDECEEERAKRPKLTLEYSYPIEKGMITDWDEMEKMWHYTFYQNLGVCPESHPVLLTIAPQTPLANKERMAQIMFETFQVPALYIGIQEVLSLYASGRTTGCVLDSGESVTRVVSIFEGHALDHAVVRMDLGGRNVTDYLLQLLEKRGYGPLSGAAERAIVKDIKETLCYTAVDFDCEMAKATSSVEETVEITDGSLVILDRERFQCAEILFEPSLCGLASDGVAKSVLESILKCDEDLRPDMFENIVLAGGNTLFPGFKDRLWEEMSALAPEATVEVLAPSHRGHSAWLGGSILASLLNSNWTNVWITREDYEENGPCCIRRRPY